MGLADAFGAEERFNIKYSELYALTESAVKFELLFNAVKCDVPHKYMRAFITGEIEPEATELTAALKGE